MVAPLPTAPIAPLLLRATAHAAAAVPLGGLAHLNAASISSLGRSVMITMVVPPSARYAWHSCGHGATHPHPNMHAHTGGRGDAVAQANKQRVRDWLQGGCTCQALPVHLPGRKKRNGQLRCTAWQPACCHGQEPLHQGRCAAARRATHAPCPCPCLVEDLVDNLKVALARAPPQHKQVAHLAGPPARQARPQATGQARVGAGGEGAEGAAG